MLCTKSYNDDGGQVNDARRKTTTTAHVKRTAPSELGGGEPSQRDMASPCVPVVSSIVCLERRDCDGGVGKTDAASVILPGDRALFLSSSSSSPSSSSPNTWLDRYKGAARSLKNVVEAVVPSSPLLPMSWSLSSEFWPVRPKSRSVRPKSIVSPGPFHSLCDKTPLLFERPWRLAPVAARDTLSSPPSSFTEDSTSLMWTAPCQQDAAGESWRPWFSHRDPTSHRDAASEIIPSEPTEFFLPAWARVLPVGGPACRGGTWVAVLGLTALTHWASDSVCMVGLCCPRSSYGEPPARLRAGGVLRNGDRGKSFPAAMLMPWKLPTV